MTGVFALGLWSLQSTLSFQLAGYLIPERWAQFAFPSVDAALPWLATATSALDGGFDGILEGAFLASLGTVFYRRYHRLVWPLALAVPLFTSLMTDTVPEILYTFVTGELSWLITFFLFWKIFQFDALGAFSIFAIARLLSSITVFWEKGGPGYQQQAWPLVVLAILLGLAATCFRPPERASPPA